MHETAHETCPHRSTLLGRGVLAASLASLGVIGLATATKSIALPSNCSGTTSVTCTFSYNGTTGSDGSVQTWTVPAGVMSAHFDLLGAAGYSANNHTGLGGETTGIVALIPGATVNIRVGGHPADGATGGGYNGGGEGGFGDERGAGGGATDVRVGGDALSNRVLVAGGGGGNASTCFAPDCAIAGSGGGTQGGGGTSSPRNFFVGGGGGDQIGPGLGQGGGGDGGAGVGGDAAGAQDVIDISSGAGGGGYFGGGAGGLAKSGDGVDAVGAGGAGSGFVNPDPTKVTSGSTANGMSEGDGSVVITYTAPQSSPATPALRIGDARSLEGNSGTHAMSFAVTLSAASSQQVTVQWATVSGTAHSPSDYVAASGTITFTPGQTSTSVPVTIKGDHTVEPNETFKVKLTSPQNATIADGKGVGTIKNDD
jgi:hypothetical protein